MECFLSFSFFLFFFSVFSLSFIFLACRRYHTQRERVLDEECTKLRTLSSSSRDALVLLQSEFDLLREQYDTLLYEVCDTNDKGSTSRIQCSMSTFDSSSEVEASDSQVGEVEEIQRDSPPFPSYFSGMNSKLQENEIPIHHSSEVISQQSELTLRSSNSVCVVETAPPLYQHLFSPIKLDIESFIFSLELEIDEFVDRCSQRVSVLESKIDSLSTKIKADSRIRHSESVRLFFYYYISLFFSTILHVVVTRVHSLSLILFLSLSLSLYIYECVYFSLYITLSQSFFL